MLLVRPLPGLRIHGHRIPALLSGVELAFGTRRRGGGEEREYGSFEGVEAGCLGPVFEFYTHGMVELEILFCRAGDVFDGHCGAVGVGVRHDILGTR